MKDAFISSFEMAAPLIAKRKGYISHSLQQCLEDEQKFLLMVEWETLEDHTIGFRQSDEYQKWKTLLHHFYNPFPVVAHFAPMLADGRQQH